MAEVSINIRKVDPNIPNNVTTIMVSGTVSDDLLSPFTVQLSDLLSATAHATPSAAPSAAPPVG